MMKRASKIGFAVVVMLYLGLPAWSGDLGDKLQIHGFLTQAFAISDGAQIYGITEDGTSEYRKGALQLRYQLTEDDAFLLQLSHERLGKTLGDEFRDDVELDWLFYNRFIGENTYIRIGRVPIPTGLYNEIRDVGTLLPFFRPPYAMYSDGAWTNDTVDGLVLSHTFKLQSDWSLKSDVYFGEWQRLETDPYYGAAMADCEDGYGGQLWINTPFKHLRLGVGIDKFTVKNGLYVPEAVSDVTIMYYSLDGDFDYFRVRGEHYEADDKANINDWEANWIEVKVPVTGKLSLATQWEEAKSDAFDFDLDWYDDVAFGVIFAWRPDLVLKAEYHWWDGYYVEDPIPDPWSGDDPLDVNYAIISLSVHF